MWTTRRRPTCPRRAPCSRRSRRRRSTASAIQKAIQGYFAALLRGQELRQESLRRWLHGEEVSPEDMRDLRSIGVTEKITRMNAFKMLRSLCQVVRALDYSGLALLFDEGDRMMSVGGRSEKVATDNLREVIDRSREELPGAMFVYAVPPAFITDIVPKYPPSSSASRRRITSRAPTPSARRSAWSGWTCPTTSC